MWTEMYKTKMFVFGVPLFNDSSQQLVVKDETDLWQSQSVDEHTHIHTYTHKL